MFTRRIVVFGVGFSLLLFMLSGFAVAQDPMEETTAATAELATESPPDAAPATTFPNLGQLQVALDTVWTMIAAFLVMWMQAGFALVEAGLTRAKNAVNICMKNLLDFCFGSIAFWAIGFGLMFGAGNAFMGTDGLFGLMGADNSPASGTDYQGAYAGIAWPGVPLSCKFFFQMVFAATAATIVSGAMAERTKFVSYMLYSVIITAFIYPISGHWIWGGGWLASRGFWDFAGSTVVHSVGAWLALAGAIVLGPRIGKFGPDGKPRAIPGHNLVFVTLGVFILWMGWFGFNAGSTMGIQGDSGYSQIAHITLVTNLAASAGALLAILTAKIMFGKWEATMALNGALAGLVGITCPCLWVTAPAAILIGAVAGVLVVLSVVGIERFLKIDDPVGAISVHGVCGAWGTLALGLFASVNGAGTDTGPGLGIFSGGGAGQLVKQAIGVGAVFAWAFGTGLVCFLAIKYTIGLRVSPLEEAEGLDIGEHGNEAYHGFQFIKDAAV